MRMNNIDTTNMNKISPDIIIEYNYSPDIALPVGVIYVRPKTNIVSYEKAILKGIPIFSPHLNLSRQPPMLLLS